MGGIREKLRQGVAQRKRQLALHPTLTMTDLYNVLSLGGTGGAPVSCLGEPPMPQQQAPLTPKQRAIHEQGLVTVAGAAPSAPGSPETHQPDLALPSDGAESEDEAVLWPKDLAAQIALVRDTITCVGWQPADGVKALAKHFAGVRAPTIQRHVDALVALGQV